MNTKINIPTSPALVIQKLVSAGFEAGVVGGCTRDCIMGKIPHDWDICTSATPLEIQTVFKGFKQLDVGLKHGTIVILIDKEPIEITTYRIDGDYLDGRHPNEVFFTRNLIEDLSRRDYTQNAIFYNDYEGLIDPFNGIQDIESKIIRCVGDPDKRLEEDSLRILRGIRFASVLNFSIDTSTKISMLNKRFLLKNVSSERIAVEFIKLFQGENFAEIIIEFKDILEVVIPEFKLVTSNSTEFNNLKACLLSLSQINDIVIRLSVFFYFIAHCNSPSNGIHKFLQALFNRMKITNAEGINRTDVLHVIELISLVDKTINPKKYDILKTLNILSGSIIQFERLLLLKQIFNSINHTDSLKNISLVKCLFDGLAQEELVVLLKDLSITGTDLINNHIAQGKDVGILLNTLLDHVMHGFLDNTKEDLLARARTIKMTIE